MGDSILNFTEAEYTTVNISSLDGQEEKITCKYELIDAILEDGVYKIHWIKTDNDGNRSDIMDMEIIVIGPKSNNYYLYSSSLPFTSVYTKKFDIVFIYL